ncbi:hypothetical protein [Sphingomonas echinoides]|uniref:Predicted 3'-5' exonuclease PolB-like domain-containing protein n=1 Tax=Sphingomonas echinoides TaxID=59803 RepID=A0ABU4PLM3_9SPHN|nr:hypothetical protein [Sphingomonas echinoides]MDX5983684.1 hypothetical protein [Sphingomonas echinoides]
MKIDFPTEPRGPRSYIIIDLESAVLDDTGHRRYQAMERWSPGTDEQTSRRGYQRHEDPLKTPRWPFQTVVTASVMRLVDHPDGNVEIATFETFSAPDCDERGVIAGLVQAFADAPKNTELVTWGGAMHDLPLLLCAVLRHKMTLPHDWRWMAFGGDGRVHHVDFARVLTGGFKMKPIHQAEYAAALDIPAKITAAPFMVTKLIDQGRWDLVAEICEGDVITGACLLIRWRRLFDDRAEADAAEDRLLRQICELKPDRGYVAALQARRDARFAAQLTQAANDAAVLAPWLNDEAA